MLIYAFITPVLMYALITYANLCAWLSQESVRGLLGRKSQQLELVTAEKLTASTELRTTLGQLQSEQNRVEQLEVKVNDSEQEAASLKERLEDKEDEYRAEVKCMSTVKAHLFKVS